MPYLILAFGLIIFFTAGLSALTSSLNVRFRDVTFFVQALLIVWFYATPIVYSISVIPYRLMWLWRINPMASIVQLFQHVFSQAPLPGIGMFGMNALINLIIFIAGMAIFIKESKNFDDWV